MTQRLALSKGTKQMPPEVAGVGQAIVTFLHQDITIHTTPINIVFSSISFLFALCIAYQWGKQNSEQEAYDKQQESGRDNA